MTGNGGSSARGGAIGNGGVTGRGGAGGGATGGAANNGGASGNGGVTGNGGATATGGVTGNGGTKATGGASSNGGATGAGGVTGNGGAGGRGGATGNGGANATGGASSNGGSSATGGAAAGAGGTTGTLAGGGGGGLGGAGGAGGGGGSTGASLSALADAFCAAARACCPKSGFPTAPLSDCESMFPARLPTLALVNGGTVAVVDTALATCVAAYQATATSCTMAPLLGACSGVFVGTKVESDTCGVGGSPIVGGVRECKPNGGPMLCVWTADSSDPTVTGVCQKAAHGRSGDPCASSCASGQDCSMDLFTSPGAIPALCFEDDGLYCSSVTSTCAPIVALGGDCTADGSACASTGYCDNAVAPTCRAAGKLGASCSLGSSICLPELVCGSSGTCSEPGFAFASTCTGTPPLPY